MSEKSGVAGRRVDTPKALAGPTMANKGNRPIGHFSPP